MHRSHLPLAALSAVFCLVHPPAPAFAQTPTETAAPALPDLSRYPVRGIDISHHQGQIDWPAVASEPNLRFALLKATEGADFVDPTFRANWAGARKAGLAVGAYHYFRFCRSGALQARNFLAAVPRAKEALPAVLDLEYVGNCRRNRKQAVVRRELRAWLRRVERATGQQPIVYATDDAFDDYLKGSGLSFRFWSRSVGAEPAPHPGQPAWTFWQVADAVPTRGVPGGADLDLFAGTADELNALARRTRR